jgi:hypothetical protein
MYPSRSLQSLLVVIVLLILLLKRSLRNTVQIALALLGDPPAALVLILLEHPDLLQRLHDLPVYRAGSIDVVRWTRAAVLGAAMDLPHAAHTDGLAHVDVAGDGCSADVEPDNTPLAFLPV